PDSVKVGQSTTVTASCAVNRQPTDPIAVNNGVSLLRVNDSNQVIAILGTMQDNGLNGDVTANDGVYTLRFTANESQPGEIRVECSAAFQGVIQRYRSGVASVTVIVNSKTQGDPSCPCGDPIDVFTGNLFETFADYTTQGTNTLSFTRYYN